MASQRVKCLGVLCRRRNPSGEGVKKQRKSLLMHGMADKIVYRFYLVSTARKLFYKVFGYFYSTLLNCFLQQTTLNGKLTHKEYIHVNGVLCLNIERLLLRGNIVLWIWNLKLKKHVADTVVVENTTDKCKRKATTRLAPLIIYQKVPKWLPFRNSPAIKISDDRALCNGNRVKRSGSGGILKSKN